MRENMTGEMNDYFANAWKMASKLTGINLGTCEKLAKAQSDLVALWMEYGAKQMQIFDGRRDPSESVTLQSTLFAEYSSKLFDRAARMFAIVTEVNSELMSCVNSSAAETTETATSQEIPKTQRMRKANDAA